MTLEARAEDLALTSAGLSPGNISVPSVVGTDILNFNVDIVNPTGSITTPSANAKSNT